MDWTGGDRKAERDYAKYRERDRRHQRGRSGGQTAPNPATLCNNDEPERDRGRYPPVAPPDQKVTRARAYQKPPLMPNGPPLRG
jgi:hypothetical protein